MDTDSTAWLAALKFEGPHQRAAQARLHELMLKVGLKEAHRRGPAWGVGGPELDDLALQAADDAMVSLLRKLDTFRGESRFTTWAYKFVVLEVSSKLARNCRRRPSIALDLDEWDRLPEKDGTPSPLESVQYQDLVDALGRAIARLTPHQRCLFLAVVVNGVSIDAIAAHTGVTRGSIYKAVCDARHRIRTYLDAEGYLEAVLTRDP
ncbi:RNA polymerase sigma factor [Leifsonia soli]|uniref:RNA polymerase sigma-70 factor (ECF subfamily) n=1 Tax=Leifsonia soli TaxID=582665 RepID=A0A852T5F3_9MICO|nr:sigma-70 family RNA polymerase sigma factor [Leifsonia soli]NYD76045.1 RNA polymerase sigma-70 factor (ECF subfamily) [Leifsonia soli]